MTQLARLPSEMSVGRTLRVGNTIASSPKANPKRVAPEASVCLRKPPSKPGSSDLSVASNIAANGEESSHHEQMLQGYKPGEANSARTWFDDSNKNVCGERGARFYAGMVWRKDHTEPR